MSHGTSFNVELALGPILVSNFVSIFLAGVSTVQVYIYYHRYPDDKPSLKYLVGTLWTLDMANVVLSAAGAYETCVLDFGKPQNLMIVPKVLCVTLFMMAIITPLVQGFFMYQVWVISRSRILFGACCLLTLICMGAVLTLGSTSFSMQSLPSYLHKYFWLIVLAGGTNTLEDIFVTTSLCYALFKKRDKTFKETAAIVDRLILCTIQTGIITTVVDVAFLLCLILMRHNWIWLGFAVVLPRLYTNSLFACLNGRKSRNPKCPGKPHPVELTTLPSCRTPPSPAISIEVVTTREVRNDKHECINGLDKLEPIRTLDYQDKHYTIVNV